MWIDNIGDNPEVQHDDLHRREHIDSEKQHL